MSKTNYITNILNLRVENIIFKENFYKEEKINSIIHKIFEGYLLCKPKYCPKCGVLFDDNFEKHGFIISNIKLPKVSGFNTILRLHKQRSLCKHCNKAFTLTSNITDYDCHISNNVKYIVIDMYSPYVSLIKKIFSNALIIIDTFHLIQLISRSLNKTRIMVMKKDKANYNKLKRYRKLLLKSKDELNYEN